MHKLCRADIFILKKGQFIMWKRLQRT